MTTSGNALTNTIKDEDDAPPPITYLFDVEVDLRQIRFSKHIAESEKYAYSVTKSNEYKLEIEIQRSVKAGIKEFFKNKIYVINLVLNMILWALTDMDY